MDLCGPSTGPGFLSRRILCIIAIGLAVRFIVAGMLTFTYDVHSWALIISDFQAGNGLYDVSGYYYAPPWGYVLGSFSAVAGQFGLDVFGIRATEFLFVEDYCWPFSSNPAFSAFIPSEAFVLALECMLALFDIAVGYAIYRLIEHKTADARKAEDGFAFWFLCPFVIAVTCVGGMFDALSALLTCLCIYFAMKDDYILAGIMIGMAASLKLFPGILIFVLIGYVLNKSADRREGWSNVMKAGVATMATIVVLFLPQMLDGTFPDSFAFLTSRAGSDTNSGLPSLARMGTIAFYLALIAVSVLLGRFMCKYKGKDRDRALLALVFVNMAILFMYPATPQYILILAPFLIIHMLDDRAYMKPFAILCVGTTIFALAAGAANLMTLAEFTDAISTSWLIDAITWCHSDLFGGLCFVDILEYVGGVLQYLGTLALLILILKKAIRMRESGALSKHTIPFM